MALLLMGCGEAHHAATSELPKLIRAEPTTLLSGTVVQLEFDAPLPQQALILWADLRPTSGESGPPTSLVAIPVEVVATASAQVPLGAVLCQNPSRTFVARLHLTFAAESLTDAAEKATEWQEVTFSCSEALTPTFTAPSPDAIWAADWVDIMGDNFLLAEEGHTQLCIQGDWSANAGGPTQVVDGPCTVLETKNRRAARFRIPAPWTQAADGQLAAEIWLASHHTAPGGAGDLATGAIVTSAPAAIDWPTRASAFDTLWPTTLARGQWWIANGRGLIVPGGANPPPTGEASWLAVWGTLTSESGPTTLISPQNPLWLSPISGEGNRTLRFLPPASVGADGRLQGLTARAGQFSGTALLWTAAGALPVHATPFPLDLEISLPTQVVVVRITAPFYASLARFGLEQRSVELVERILQAASRPYAGVGVQFQLEEPMDYALFTVVELAGADPNGQNLLGLDNTPGKDVDNIRLDDYLGAFNADVANEGLLAYGGIFVESFLAFSPTLPYAASPLADARFDAIFAPFLPELGGTPALAQEEGARKQALEVALSTLAELVGGTVAHEVGHALGLTAQPGRLHNEGDNSRWLMDAGLFRPFGERANLPGEGPEEFSPFNRLYLNTILAKGTHER